MSRQPLLVLPSSRDKKEETPGWLQRVIVTQFILAGVAGASFIAQLIIGLAYWTTPMTLLRFRPLTYTQWNGVDFELVEVTGGAPLIWLSWFMLAFMTAGRALQASLLSNSKRVREETIVYGVNIYQWIEYMFSLGVVFFAISHGFLRVSNLWAVIGATLGVIIFCLAALGLELNHSRFERRDPNWALYVAGVLALMVLGWGPAFFHFATNFSLNEWYAWTATVIGVLWTLLTAFVCVPLRWGRCRTRFARDNYFYLMWVAISGAALPILISWVIAIAGVA